MSALKKAPKYLVVVEDPAYINYAGLPKSKVWYFTANHHSRLTSQMKKFASPGRVMLPCRLTLTPVKFRKKEDKV